MPPHTVYVIGCGHVGRSVIDLASWLGYRTIAVDDREELVTEEALPKADIRYHGSVEEAVLEHPVSPASSIVVVTRRLVGANGMMTSGSGPSSASSPSIVRLISTQETRVNVVSLR